jgi:hypothetical protein
VAAASRRNQAEDHVITSKPLTAPSTSESSPAKGARERAKKIKRSPKPMAVSKSKPHAQPQTKQDRVLAMLREKGGTTISAVMKATGWQKHSVHGFFAGMVRKKLKLKLESNKVGDERIYRIDDEAPSKKGRTKPKRGST